MRQNYVICFNFAKLYYMGQPTSKAKRLAIIALKKSKRLKEISVTLEIPYGTVKQLWRCYTALTTKPYSLQKMLHTFRLKILPFTPTRQS